MSIKRVFSSIMLCAVVVTLSMGAATGGASATASPQLTDLAPAAGLSATERTWSAQVVDYNNDGLDDVWLGYHQYVDSKLMRNNGDGTFTQVATNAWHRLGPTGAPIDRHDCAWADFDHNGLQDAVCSVGRDEPNHVKGAVDDNELWLQTSDGQFTDVGTQWGIGDPCGRGRNIAVADYNGDGWMDIFIGNDKPRGTAGDPCDNPANNYPNWNSKVFLNQGGTGFVYAPQYSTMQPAAGIGCALTLDYNRDGLPDLLACNYKTNKPELYRNTGTGFVESAKTFGLTPITDATLGDINGDGIPDLVMSDQQGFLYRLGTATGLGAAKRIYTRPAGTSTNIVGWGVAVGDINGDGKQDIYGQIHDLSLKTNPDDMVFMNNGNLTFSSLTPPSASGNACSVTVMHLTPGANASFLVQNGLEKMAGPTQLISGNFTAVKPVKK